ncbi:Tumor necrosis factor receptor superfamily member 19 [Abyssicoccus albus]|uniref:Uncharacterized protein n=1 Tax=Abyssicoccus albus TaxID=1817405 RepID=A0A3N5BKH0_9BACL|nr:hypothetical protein EDD62_1002 [Abyssicoccus albus]
MNSFLIFLVCAAFLTALLTAGRESKYGYKEEE